MGYSGDLETGEAGDTAPGTEPSQTVTARSPGSTSESVSLIFGYEDAISPASTSQSGQSVSQAPELGLHGQSEYMIGSVAVAVIFPESDGSIDPQSENWSAERIEICMAEIEAGLTWWEEQEPLANLSFHIQSYGTQTTGYEPITRPQTDEHLWVSEILTGLGYNSSGSHLEQVVGLNNYERSQQSTDWAFTIFVVDSLNDDYGQFEDGYFAYAYVGGPFFVMTYDNEWWTIDNMRWVCAHETGHIFWATDEYDGVQQDSGYLNVSDSDNESEGCIMRTIPPTGVCEATRGQVGWLDSDGDGILDPVDTTPNTTLDPGHPEFTSSTELTFYGVAEDIPLPNNNPQPWSTGNDVTINWITQVQYRLNGGDWEQATAVDGQFDEVSEAFTFTTSSLDQGTYLIEIRAQNSVGNWGTGDPYYVNISAAPPPAPIISSATHPDEDTWYNENNLELSWTIPSDNITGYLYILDQIQTTEPTSDNSSIYTTDNSASLYDVEDGTWYFHVQAQDDEGNWGDTAHFQVNIDTTPPPAPVISSITHPEEGTWYSNNDPSFTWTTPTDTSEIEGYSFVLDQTADTIPDENVDTADNSASFADRADGTWYFHVRAKDNAGNWGATAHYQVNIDTAPPPAPTISSSTHPVEGTWYSNNDPSFTWTEPDDTSGIAGYSFILDQVSNTVPNSIVDTTGNSASFTDRADGVWYFHVRAKDNAGNWGHAAHYVVRINQPPIAVDDSYSTDENTTLSIQAPGVLANDTDIDPLIAIMVDTVSHGSLTLYSNGSFVYVPATNFYGTDSFTYRASDGKSESNLAVVTITVAPVNDPPVAVDDAYSMRVAGVLYVGPPGVLGNDTDAENDPLTAILVSTVRYGTLTLNDDGSFMYRPNADFKSTDSFTYRASDGQAESEIATVTITVAESPPSITSISPQQLCPGCRGEIIIMGSDFKEVTSVYFGPGIDVESFTVESSTQITATVVVGKDAATGPRQVFVNTTSGTASLEEGFSIGGEAPGGSDTWLWIYVALGILVFGCTVFMLITVWLRSQSARV